MNAAAARRPSAPSPIAARQPGRFGARTGATVRYDIVEVCALCWQQHLERFVIQQWDCLRLRCGARGGRKRAATADSGDINKRR